MLLFKRKAHLFIARALSIIGIIILAGCTVRPVYQQNAQTHFAIAYAKPATEFDQTINRELAFLLGKSDAPKYKLIIKSSSEGRSIFKNSSQFLNSEVEISIRANYTLKDAQTDEILTSGQRVASALYQTNPQLIAQDSAVRDAKHRAAKAVAKQIHIALITYLTR